MNIGEAAKASGVSAKMIRHYEAMGIIPKAERSDSGYRRYSSSDIRILVFVRRARGLGFSMKEIKKLVGLWQDRDRSSAEVKALATAQIEALEAKIQGIQEMVQTLKYLAQHCHGDGRPDCPILEGLARE